MVLKRDCSLQEFDKTKIYNAILKAMPYGEGEKPKIAQKIADELEERFKDEEEVSISDIESAVFNSLITHKQRNTARAYEGYRRIAEYQRETENNNDKDVLDLLDNKNEYLKDENSNKNSTLQSTVRDYLAGIVSTDITKRHLLPTDIVQAHEEGIIHFHDADYFAQYINNCCLINLEDMLNNGTVINGYRIDPQHRLLTATTVATQIIVAVTSNQYGGATINLSHLSPFVRKSKEYYEEKYLSHPILAENEELRKSLVEQDLKKEIRDAVQTFNYQINSMSTTNGQAPFISVFMYINDNEEYKEETVMLIEEFFRQRILGLKNRTGAYVTPAFPKLLYVLDDNNTYEGSEYFWLTKLGAECTAKRMVPDYISAKVMKELKEGNVFGCMGCRSMLSPWYDENGKAKFWGRFNIGVVTLSLADAGLSANRDLDKFWEIMEERTELCHKALLCRYNRLKGTSADVAPILWRDGAFARLNAHESIDKLLVGGYATISLGYAGLYECVKALSGESLTEPNGNKLGLEIMEFLKKKTEQWKVEDNLGYAVYGTPIESTTYKFAKCLKNRFGEDVFVKLDGRDRNFITNSYHIPVFEEIDIFSKLEIEAEFQKLSTGGAITYGESADMTQNIEAVIKVIQFIYEKIMYAEINTKSDYCMVCGSRKELKMIDKGGKLKWKCTECGNEDETLLNFARRVCGYISTTVPNQGRLDEIGQRYVHLDNH